MGAIYVQNKVSGTSYWLKEPTSTFCPIKRNKDMPDPTNLTKLQGFLGFANNYHVYISNMHELTALLNALLKKDA